jgi:hypothetical protein
MNNFNEDIENILRLMNIKDDGKKSYVKNIQSILEQKKKSTVDKLLEPKRFEDRAMDYVTKPAEPKETKTIGYFKFGNMAQIPYVKGAKFKKITTLDTGVIMGLTKKDSYGYYEEIYVPTYGQKLRRYYPKNEWRDWAFLKNRGIPYAFTTKDGKKFHLSLKLVDPLKAVADLDDPSNVSRGWALTYPGVRSNSENDSMTGYYSTEGNKEVPYNITAPVIPGDMSTFNLDDRGEFDKFMDGWAGTISQVIISMAVFVLTRNFAVSRMAAARIVAVESVKTRLFMASLFAETITNVPMAIYYFNRPGYEAAGWMSLAFIALPFINKFTPLGNIISDFSQDTCVRLSKQLMESNMKTLTNAELKVFIESLDIETRSLFYEVARNRVRISALLRQSESQLLNVAGKSQEYLKSRAEMLAIINKPPRPLIKDITIDFSVTYTFGKLMEKVVDSYMKYSAQKGKDVQQMTKDELKKMSELLKNVDRQLEQLPEWVKFFSEDAAQINLPTFEITEEMTLELAEKGVFSEELKNKLFQKSANYLNEFLRNIKTIDELIPYFKEINEYIDDPEYKNRISPELRKTIEDLMEENRKKYSLLSKDEDTETKKPIETLTTTNAEVKPVEQQPTEQPTDKILYQYFSTKKNEWVTSTENENKNRSLDGFTTRELIYNQELKQWVEYIPEKINNTVDENYDYKTVDGKYYYSQKGKNSWVEATGDLLEKIVKFVPFD